MMTAEEFMQLDEDEWRGYELVRGELVQVGGPRVAPKHGHRMVRLCSVFGNFADTNHIAFFTAFCFYALARNPDTVRSVDISAIRNERMPTAHDEDQVFETAPDFVIEIWAPTDRADVLPERIEDFLSAGTKQFWLLDQDKRTVTIYSADTPPRIVEGSELLTADPVLPGFSCTLDELFR